MERVNNLVGGPESIFLGTYKQVTDNTILDFPILSKSKHTKVQLQFKVNKVMK